VAYDILGFFGQVVFWFILLAPLGQIAVELVDRRRYTGMARLESNPKLSAPIH